MLHAVAVLHDQDTEDFARIAKPPSIDRRTAIVGGGVAALIGTGLVAWQTGLLGGKGGIANRIAVLPLANLSGDPKQNYLSDGLTAEIRSMLAQNGALQVVGQASSEAFEEKKLDATDIAKKLRAAFLIDGTMRIANDMIRITIEMIDGKTGINRSPKIFEKSMDDLFLLQREIAGAVSAELSSRIALSDPTKIPIGGTANAVAFDHYLRGRDLYLHGRDEAEERAAITHFDAAIATDPKFAAAHAGRSRSLTAVASQFGSAREIKIHHEAAVQSAHRAVELAPLFADAQSTLAFTLFQGGLDIRGAKKPFELSRKLGEGEAPVMARFAIYCASTGRNREAASAIDGALILDPLNALVQRVAGTVHYAARRFDAAISATREALSLNPNLGDTHARIGMVQIAQKKYAEALKSFDKESHKWSKLAGIAIAQHHLGNSVAAKTAMAGLTSDTEVVSLYQQGQVLAQWGQLEAAVTMLLRAYEQRDAGMTALFFDPMLDPVRTQPRFIGLLKTMGYA